jgi:hypothetical protein
MITTAGGNLCYEPAIYNDEDELCFNKKIIMMALLLNLFYTVQTKGSDIKQRHRVQNPRICSKTPCVLFCNINKQC